jgi:hypothetical protein
LDPDVARAQIAKLIPAKVTSRDGWAVDMFAAFEALGLPPSANNTCAVIAIVQQDLVQPPSEAKRRDLILE